MPQAVAQICVERAVSVEELVDRSGLERGRVEAILLARWTPSPEERRSIADVLGVSVDAISWGHATPIQHLYGHGPS
jgi:transcriptional regulator with XRE-family HTH domain